MFAVGTGCLCYPHHAPPKSVGVRVYVCMDMGMCMYGCVHVWVCGCMGVWMYGRKYVCVDTLVYGCRCIYAYGWLISARMGVWSMCMH